MRNRVPVLVVLCFCFFPVRTLAEDDLAKKGKARLDAAQKAYESWVTSNILANERPISLMTYQLSVGWLNAELDLAKKKQDRIVAHRGHLQRMNDWEKAWDGTNRKSTVFAIIGSFQTEAEYWLAKEGSGKQ